jgi:hypothetical protein
VNSIDLAFNSIDPAFDSIDLAFDSIDLAFDSIDLAFDSIDVAFDSIGLAFNSGDLALHLCAPGSNVHAPGLRVVSTGMGEPSSDTEYLALLRRQDWGRLMADLVLYGRGKKRLSPDLAEQLAAEAVSRVCDPARSPWDISRGAQLFTHLMWVFDSELEHFRAKRKRRKTDPTGDDLPEPPPDSDDNPEVRAERKGNLAELRDKLFVAVENRPLARQLLVLEEEQQISDIDEQVRLTGATRAQAYEARRILATAARELLAGGEHHLSRERLALQRRDTLRSVKKVT